VCSSGGEAVKEPRFMALKLTNYVANPQKPNNLTLRFVITHASKQTALVGEVLKLQDYTYVLPLFQGKILVLMVLIIEVTLNTNKIQ